MRQYDYEMSHLMPILPAAVMPIKNRRSQELFSVLSVSSVVKIEGNLGDRHSEAGKFTLIFASFICRLPIGAPGEKHEWGEDTELELSAPGELISFSFLVWIFYRRTIRGGFWDLQDLRRLGGEISQA